MNIPNVSTEQTTSAATAHTVDGEGLINNYAIEPEMYVEDGSPLSSAADSRLTIVDIFPTEDEAKSAVLEMQQQGLRTNCISIAAKNYDEPNPAINKTNWKDIIAEGSLATVLIDLGISDLAASQFVDAVNEGKFLVIESGSDREASQTLHVLENIGHSVQVT